MNPSTSPTPRTDAIQYQGNPVSPTLENKMLRALSRQLERELSEKTNEVNNWHQHYRDEASKAQKLKQAFIALSKAAQAVIDRWETPLWKDAEPTASVIYRLRDALNTTDI